MSCDLTPKFGNSWVRFFLFVFVLSCVSRMEVRRSRSHPLLYELEWPFILSHPLPSHVTCLLLNPAFIWVPVTSSRAPPPMPYFSLWLSGIHRKQKYCTSEALSNSSSVHPSVNTAPPFSCLFGPRGVLQQGQRGIFRIIDGWSFQRCCTTSFQLCFCSFFVTLICLDRRNMIVCIVKKKPLSLDSHSSRDTKMKLEKQEETRNKKTKRELSHQEEKVTSSQSDSARVFLHFPFCRVSLQLQSVHVCKLVTGRRNMTVSPQTQTTLTDREKYFTFVTCLPSFIWSEMLNFKHTKCRLI